MSSISPNPIRVFLTLVCIVFLAEAVVMLLLPVLLPPLVDARVEAVLDSCLLTLFCGPLIWWVIIGPLRSMAAAEKVAVVARMATGLAHEMRNPLTSIKLLVQSNRETLETDNELREDLQIIEDELRRIERSLNTFLDFARPRKPDQRPLDLTGLVDRTFKLIEFRSAKQNVDLRLVAAERPVFVEGDWEQIQQLLLNLALNALDAMPHGGRLEVEIQRSVNSQVRLVVADTGPGITPQVKARLFQPFVTSKETGVGLGLVISRRIAKDHGGRLIYEGSEKGRTRFVLELPRSQSSDKSGSQNATAASDLLKAGQSR